jgi:UPF0755 protein
MTRKDQLRALQIVLGSVLVVLVALGGVALVIALYPNHRLGGPTREARITVGKGTTLGEIARRLAVAGVIEHPSWFRFYAAQRGVAQRIRAGQYSFSSRMTPREVLQRLVEGTPGEEATVTVPEGKNLVEIGDLLEQATICPRADFVRAARDERLVQKLGLPASAGNAEGYLFPDTYRFRPGTPATQVITTLVHHAQKVLGELKAAHTSGVAALQKTYHFGDREIVIMASLVEKETAQPDERPRIAGVFLNRLRLPTFVPHLLQTDPTIVYGCTVPLTRSDACKDFSGRIRRKHLEDRDNVYNTYTHAGLPPGPISNPGRAAIEAVLAPEASTYLYFVSKNDGTHYFSKTRAEHQQAVEKYQKQPSGT